MTQSTASAFTLADLLRVERSISPRVIESPWLPENTVVLMNDLDLPIHRPVGWDSMTAEEQLRWGAENGMTVVVRKGMTDPSDGDDITPEDEEPTFPKNDPVPEGGVPLPPDQQTPAVEEETEQ